MSPGGVTLPLEGRRGGSDDMHLDRQLRRGVEAVCVVDGCGGGRLSQRCREA